MKRDMEAHQEANQTYIEEGIKLLELAQRARRLFESQAPTEKRKLDFAVSNCSWQAGELKADYRRPFDLQAVAVAEDRNVSGGGSPSV